MSGVVYDKAASSPPRHGAEWVPEDIAEILRHLSGREMWGKVEVTLRDGAIQYVRVETTYQTPDDVD